MANYYRLFNAKSIFIVISKVDDIVEGDPKASFSMASTPRCWGGRYSIPWITPIYPWSIPYNAEY